MNRSEAGMLGGLKSSEASRLKRLKRIAEYDKNPNRCAKCNKILNYDQRSQNTCSRSCASKITNSLRKSNKKIFRCIRCNKNITTRSGKKYCSDHCNKLHIAEEAIRLNKASHETLRGYLLKTTEGCSQCHLIEWQGKKLTLQLHHIDGNSSNNTLKNVQLLCPNCHSITPNFGRKNLGNGRAYRRERYAEGKTR